MAKALAKSPKPRAGSRQPKADKPLRILMIASEAQPFSKTGGLADVATALPRALARLGHDVTLITPRYRGAPDGPVVAALPLEVAAHRFDARLMEVSVSPRILLDCPELYDRSGIYYDAHGDYADNAVRYAFLSAAAIDWASQPVDSAQGKLPEPFDIIHAHDWQGGLAPIYARRLGTGGTPGTRTVLTIHNLAYQGVFDKTWVPRLGLNWADFTLGGFEFFDRSVSWRGRQLRRCDRPSVRPGRDPASERHGPTA